MSGSRTLMALMMLMFLCISNSAQASKSDDCDPDREACFNDSLSSIIGSRINDTIGTALVIGVVIYFIIDDVTDDPNYQARLLSDYSKGKGLRLTAYDQPLNVSLLPHQKRFQLDAYQSRFQQQLDHQPIKLQLISVNYEW